MSISKKNISKQSACKPRLHASDVIKQHEEYVLHVMATNHLRVAVVGNVDAGKSTLIGTLTSCVLDNGRGLSRSKIVKYKHEVETGRTSTITSHLLGYNDDGSIVTNSVHRSCEAVVARSASKVVTMMDMAGHEKYFKTTVAGLSRGMADYALVLVNSSQPPTVMTLHHLNLCICNGIPVIVLLTKTDACPDHVLSQTRKEVNEVLKSSEVGKMPYSIKNAKDIDIVHDKLHILAPIIEASCVTGEGLELLNALLFALPRRRCHENKMNRPFEFLVEEIFTVSGVGLVLSGFVNTGQWKHGDAFYLGPLKDGSFIKTTAKSVHVAQTNVARVWAGHSACFAVSLSKEQRKLVGKRRGMVLLQNLAPVTQRFEAEICLMKGDPVTMMVGRYQTTMHILHLKRPVTLVKVESLGRSRNSDPRSDLSSSNFVLRPGCHVKATFAFTQGPEYVRKGMRLILRDGHVRGIGRVIGIPSEEEGLSH